jgi:molecular chaperone GrpE
MIRPEDSEGRPSAAESRPEERPVTEPVPDAPATAERDAAEPAGEGSADNEAEMERATQRPREFGAAGAPGGVGGRGEERDGGEPREPAAGGEPPNGAARGESTYAAAGGEAGDELARAREQRDRYLSVAQRAQADFDNYRKRAAREAAAAGERAKGALVRELLPVVDNLERALASARPDEQHLAEGVRLVHAELVAALERNGVEQFDPKGDRFDPTFHEALSMRREDGAEAGVVLDVVEKGYKVNGTVLRPARVVVSG